MSIVSNRLKFSLMPTSVLQWALIYSQGDLDSLGIGTLGGPNGPNEICIERLGGAGERLIGLLTS